jgi:hypothetical protein
VLHHVSQDDGLLRYLRHGANKLLGRLILVASRRQREIP